MPCDLKRKSKTQTVQSRADEIRRMVTTLAAGLASGRIKAVVGVKGGIAFIGLTEAERDGVTDACAFRRIMATGTAAAKLAIQRAEMLAGRAVDRQVVATGYHSHDGANWGTR